jgi:hypothetical protein
MTITTTDTIEKDDQAETQSLPCDRGDRLGQTDRVKTLLFELPGDTKNRRAP